MYQQDFIAKNLREAMPAKRIAACAIHQLELRLADVTLLIQIYHSASDSVLTKLSPCQVVMRQSQDVLPSPLLSKQQFQEKTLKNRPKLSPISIA